MVCQTRKWEYCNSPVDNFRSPSQLFINSLSPTPSNIHLHLQPSLVNHRDAYTKTVHRQQHQNILQQVSWGDVTTAQWAFDSRNGDNGGEHLSSALQALMDNITFAHLKDKSTGETYVTVLTQKKCTILTLVIHLTVTCRLPHTALHYMPHPHTVPYQTR